MFGKTSEPKLKENKKIQEILSQVGNGVENIGGWVGPRIDKAGHSLTSGIEKTIPKLQKSLDDVGPKVAGAFDNAAPKLRTYLGTTVPDLIKDKEKLLNDHLIRLSEKLKNHEPGLTKSARKKEKAELVATILAEFGINKRHLKRRLRKISKSTARTAQEAGKHVKGKVRGHAKRGLTRGKGWLITLVTLISGIALISLWKSTRPPPADEDEADQESQWQTPVIESDDF